MVSVSLKIIQKTSSVQGGVVKLPWNVNIKDGSFKFVQVIYIIVEILVVQINGEEIFKLYAFIGMNHIVNTIFRGLFDGYH